MSGFFRKVFERGGWKESTYRNRDQLPPRAFINPKDFRWGKDLAVAFAAPEFPRFAPPNWQAGVLEYVSEEEAAKIFEYHYRELRAEQWRRFAREHEKMFSVARGQRTYHRQVKRNKRAYNYWSGYVMGMKVAFRIVHTIFALQPKSYLKDNA